MYKITFTLKSPVSFIEKPTFDGMLAWCWMKEKYGTVPQKLNLEKEELENFDELPLEKHHDGYFMASWMLYNEGQALEFTGSWKKRWANEHDHLTDFSGKKRKIRTSAGEFKAYNMPIVLNRIKEVWFYFESDNVAMVKKLLSHLWGIGKKTSQGYGEIGGFAIEEIDFNPFEGKVIRPVPAKVEDLKQSGTLSVRMMGYKPPYWLPENQGFCWA